MAIEFEIHKIPSQVPESSKEKKKQIADRVAKSNVRLKRKMHEISRKEFNAFLKAHTRFRN